MSDLVADPDPDHAQECDNLEMDTLKNTASPNHAGELEPDEPIAHYGTEADGCNANDDSFFYRTDRPPTPAPEETEPFMNNEQNENEVVPMSHAVTVNTAAVNVESICGNYDGIFLLERLQFILDSCPPLRRDATYALIHAVKKNSTNVARYSNLFQSLDNLPKSSEESNIEKPIFDQSWVDATSVQYSSRLDMLLTEYKKHRDEGVKESTRRSVEELFQHHVQNGSYQEALKLFGRGMKEYCSQFKHFLSMWLSWLEVSVIAGEWARVAALISQAERSISEAEDFEKEQSAKPAGHFNHGLSPRSITDLIVATKSKVNAINGLHKLASGKYCDAIAKFLLVDADQIDGGWLISPSDLAIYAGLTSLTSLSREHIRKKLLSDSQCRKFLEAEPLVVELLNCFLKSRFTRMFQILSKMKDRFLLDMFLSPQVENLYAEIRDRAMIQYLQPFSSAMLSEMSSIFDIPVITLEDDLVRLIEKGLLSAKIDSINGLVVLGAGDKRHEVYAKINSVADEVIYRSELAVMQAVFQQGRMFITSEGNNKRKNASSSDCASDSQSTPMPNRAKMSIFSGKGSSTACAVPSTSSVGNQKLDLLSSVSSKSATSSSAECDLDEALAADPAPTSSAEKVKRK